MQFPLATSLSHSAIEALARGILLGLGAAMPIGPVNIQIARRVLCSGFLAGAAVGLGAVTIDVTYALLSTLSFVRLLNRPEILIPIASLGVLFLGYLGIESLRAAVMARRRDPLADSVSGAKLAVQKSIRSAYGTGLLMTLLNPLTLVFWFSVVPATSMRKEGTQGIADGPTSDLPMLCVGVFIGTVAWVLVFGTAMALAARSANRRAGRQQKWLAATDAVGGLTLLGFATAGFLRLVRLLL